MTFLQRILSLLVPMLVFLAAPSHAQAEFNLSEHFQLSGFATLGAIKGGNAYLGLPQDLQRDPVFDGDWDLAEDSLLGIQLNARIDDQWSGAIQLIGKDRQKDSFENSVAWAFLAYRPTTEWTVRAGRIGFDLYMLSEYRSVGFSYLLARPSMEFYTQVAFDNFDGMDLAWSRAVGEGQLRAKVFAGKTQTDVQRNGQEFEVKLDRIWGASLNWETDHWQWRATVLSTNLTDDDPYFPGLDQLGAAYQQIAPIWPEATYYEQQIAIDDTRVDYLTMGVAYTNAPWQVQAELGRILPQVNLFPTVNSGYVSLGRQFGPTTVYAMVAAADSSDLREVVTLWPDDPLNPFALQVIALQQATQTVFDSIAIDQHTFSLGLRWDLRYDLALKLQWDRSWVERYGAGLWQIREVPPDDQVLDTFTINLNGIF